MGYPSFEVRHYIDGQFVDGGPRFEIRYPATNAVIGGAPEAGHAEVDAAVSAAERAFKTWGKAPAAERRRLLKGFAELIRGHEQELVAIESWDVGRTLRENQAGYIPRIAANIKFFADFAVTHASQAYPMDNGYINYVLHQPVGVAALITPWNIPLLLETWSRRRPRDGRSARRWLTATRWS
jgi:aminomuconate-semialdehyde/2-hydroxymuconate-6-semialdehyde dehydrogenase